VKLVPYHRFEITSALKREDVLTAMASRVEKRKWFAARWPNSANDERFDGTMRASGFNVTRIMGYRNSFAPVIDGEVHDAGRFSRIVITMRPAYIVMVVLGFITLIFVTAFMALDGGSSLSGFFLMALFYVIVLAGFWFEANKTEQTLRRIFQAM
jgi:hypothetical protein